MLKLEIGKKYFLDGNEIEYITHRIHNKILHVEAHQKILQYFDNNSLEDILKEYPTLEYKESDIKTIKPILGIFGKPKKVLDGYFYSIGKRFIISSNNWAIVYWDKFENSPYNSE
jgi:hypothetical protein